MLSSFKTAIAFTVVPTSGKVSKMVLSVDWPFSLGGGFLSALGKLGIQPPKSNCWGLKLDKIIVVYH